MYFENFPKEVLHTINNKKESFLLKPKYRWIATAAAVLFLLLFFEFNNQTNQTILTESELALYINENIDLYQDDELFFASAETEFISEQEQFLIDNANIQELEEFFN